jgi:hypothetical protein
VSDPLRIAHLRCRHRPGAQNLSPIAHFIAVLGSSSTVWLTVKRWPRWAPPPCAGFGGTPLIEDGQYGGRSHIAWLTFISCSLGCKSRRTSWPSPISDHRPGHRHQSFASRIFHDRLRVTAFRPGCFGPFLTIWRFSLTTRLVSHVQELKQLCMQTLMDRQLLDGGWSFSSTSTQSAVEPTALALLGLSTDAAQERAAAINLLLNCQNPNGSWPAFAGDDPEGSGLTGLVLYALQRCGATEVPIERAIQWLLSTRGQESHWFWKWKFRTADRHVRFDPDKFGWPWTHGTVSWVVPTAYSLLALKAGSACRDEDLLQFRVQRGVEMLYDRLCPHGGWNAGNGVVYGQPMAPHPDTTALALLALQAEPSTPSITASLDWLEQRAKTCSAPWSLAWSVLALNAFRRRTELLIGRFAASVRPAQIENSAALAMVSLALACANERNALGVTP